MGHSTGAGTGADDYSLRTGSQHADPRLTARGREDLPTALEHIAEPQQNQEQGSSPQAGDCQTLQGAIKAAEQDVSTKRPNVSHLA